MTDASRRLGKLEAWLTPSQAIAVYLEREVATAPSLAAHVIEEKGLPRRSLPLLRLCEQVRHGVEQGSRGEPKEAVGRRLQQAMRDLGFLYFLHWQINERLLGEWRLRCFQLLVLLRELRDLVLAVPGEEARTAHALDHVGPLLTELLASQRAVELVITRYFGGQEVRFPDVVAQQTLLHAQLTEALAIYASAVEPVTPKPAPKRRRRGQPPTSPPWPTAAALTEAAEPPAQELASLLVTLARSEALRFIGETEQAWTTLDEAFP